MDIPHREDFVHHQKTDTSLLREVVFGVEDGMVSTLGALLGIAVGSQSQFIAILSGSVIIAVESISMGVGSYLSSKSLKETKKRMLAEEKEEVENYPDEEEKELVEIYTKNGWSKKLALSMAKEARSKPRLMLNEMAVHELGIVRNEEEKPIRNGLIMGISYIVGGLIPLVSYIVLPISSATVSSIVFTGIGLFILGVGMTKFTKRSALRSGLEMLAIAGVASVIGYAIGSLARGF